MDGCRGGGGGGVAEASASSTALGQAARAQDPGGSPASPNVTDAAPGLPPCSPQACPLPFAPPGSIPAPACCSRLQVSSLCFHLAGRP